MDDDARQERIESHLAELARMVEDLSETVARQEATLDRLGKRVAFLMEREAEREADGGAAVFADRRPPHW
ncbi:SlyX protein [Rhodosalinus sediminis]|uniref:SlyX protein n=1 Tax=Rhodosalinus sediminis TaxID=1940533 RepID=A0A3D9BYF3_9RHOB|nr:SlyX family protein [Rhodosalinus sediminis]REC58518.1 SlyX protein [Rhodosalinus sediminis]